MEELDLSRFPIFVPEGYKQEPAKFNKIHTYFTQHLQGAETPCIEVAQSWFLPCKKLKKIYVTQTQKDVLRLFPKISRPSSVLKIAMKQAYFLNSKLRSALTAIQHDQQT